MISPVLSIPHISNVNTNSTPTASAVPNKYRVFGIMTDTILKDGKPLLKDGKRQHGAVGWYRIMNPLKKLGADIAIGINLSPKVENAMEFKRRGDIWFSKISDNEGIDHIYGSHRDFTQSKLVIDLDDDPGSVNEGHPDFKALEEKKDMRIRMVKLADHLVVATEPIKEAVKHLNPYITVIPNAIDPEIWKHKNKRRNDGKIRIGWMSSGSHFADLPIINPVMMEILAKYPNVEFHFAGMTWDEHKQDRFFHHVGRSGYMDFPEWYASLGIDISVAPLKDTQFNRCKSNIKWMEAAMLEIPTVASDVEPYKCIRHGKDGFLATNKDQWIKYLSKLIESEELRRQIGKEAKKTVLENWTTDKVLPLYEKLFVKLLEKKDITVVTSITGGKDTLKPQPDYSGVEYVAYLDTDQKDSQWKTRKACDKFVKPVMNAKIHKLLTHKYVDTPYIVWVDGNITLKKDPHELVKLMGDKDFAFFKHPGRDCLFEEAIACVELGKGNVSEMAEQTKEYAKMNFPEHAGMCELTCFIRKNNPKANAAFERWWTEVSRFSNRDQIAFPVAFKGEKWATIPGSIACAKDIPGMDKHNERFPGNEYFQWVDHIYHKD